MNPKYGRLALLKVFILWYLLCSFLLRIMFLTLERSQLSGSLLDMFKTLTVGVFFDIGTLSIISLPIMIYLTVFPNKYIGKLLDRIIIWLFSTLLVFILVFTFLAEVTFWEEFHSRFNFIAVDYLIYTHEVIANIKQSYPLPLLLIGVVTLTVVIVIFFVQFDAYKKTFRSRFSIKQRILAMVTCLAIATGYIGFVDNNMAEWSSNRYHSEISKSGIFSFFAAFRNNQMKFPEFYSTLQNKAAFDIVKDKLAEKNAVYHSSGYSISRKINADGKPEIKKNVVFILLESFSGSFMREFGNEKNLTPFLDSLSHKSIFFNNIYATGTRTVRGIEAMTLSIPPTPGQSIVKRPENSGLYTVGSVFTNKGYQCNFFYGGDGYFDNMNAYMGGNGFDIYDRGHGSILSDKIKAKRTITQDSEVTFENAWGLCDEDIYSKMIKVSDEHYKNKKPFFNFILTTSNHRPFTYPSGKIDIPSGTGRDGAVKYTDYALAGLFKKIKNKPWYNDTIFIIISDHCASSAGKNEIDVANYRIPAFILNMPGEENRVVTKQCSQIDLFPTFFSMMHWNYRSNFFGKNIINPAFEERAFVSTYRKLSLLKGNELMILSDQRKNSGYKWLPVNNVLSAVKIDPAFLAETIAYYQTADYLYTNKQLK